MNVPIRRLLTLATLGTVALLVGCERPPIEAEQVGYRGTGMQIVANPRATAALERDNQGPTALPPVSGGPPASAVYQNVQVLGDLSVAEFNRLMTAITEWVSPEQGCNYCHEGANLAEDNLYTKVVARRMLEMTRNINEQWHEHVGDTGVTCYTCHRGKNVPEYVWFADPMPQQAGGMAARRQGQNMAAAAVGSTSLPYDPFTELLGQDGEIRVLPPTALPYTDRAGASIQKTEQTYALMMHFSNSLNVNCTFCHNTRNFHVWEQSPPQRVTAWHGIRMSRELNAEYLEPLTPVYPPHRLGPRGDAAKLNCSTCHQGVNKPLLGVSMLQDYPELAAASQPAVEEAPALYEPETEETTSN